MDAIEKIVGKVRNDRGKIVTAIFIDVFNNAHNTANWDLILLKARRRGISLSLLRVLASYLKDRKVMLEPGSVEKVYAGVPQGSVLGPTSVYHTQEVRKYLGVTLDYTLTFTKQVEDLTAKATKIIKTLNILLASTYGPHMSKRRVLAGALQSVPIWASALQFERASKKLKMHQRAIAIRCCSFADAAVVLAGIVPIDLLIKERAKTQEKTEGNFRERGKKSQSG